MTTLVVEELKTTLDQLFTWEPHPRARVVAVRPHLYVHNNPAGTFRISIMTPGGSTLVKKDYVSANLYASIGTANAYAHIYFPVIFDDKIYLPKGEYKIRLQGIGYTFSESSYLGWVRDHEDLKVPLAYTPASDLSNPLSYELWVTK